MNVKQGNEKNENNNWIKLSFLIAVFSTGLQIGIFLTLIIFLITVQQC